MREPVRKPREEPREKTQKRPKTPKLERRPTPLPEPVANEESESHSDRWSIDDASAESQDDAPPKQQSFGDQSLQSDFVSEEEPESPPRKAPHPIKDHFKDFEFEANISDELEWFERDNKERERREENEAADYSDASLSDMSDSFSDDDEDDEASNQAMYDKQLFFDSHLKRHEEEDIGRALNPRRTDSSFSKF